MARYSVGIDIGGTFTDLVFYDHDSGSHLSGKVLTTHGDPADAVIDGIASMVRANDINPASIGRVVHATTLFTNALIERKGARTGLITTEGFRDTLEIARERKYDIYDLFIEMPAPPVPRDLIIEIPERMRANGQVKQALDVQALVRAADALVELGVESLAICFLHAYANPAHERLAAQLLAARHPQLFISTSHAVAPVIREYERSMTTVVNAYIMPLAQRYLDSLANRLVGLGIPAPLFLMLSNGGLTHLDEAKRAPVQLLESGPAAGALAGAYFGRGAKLPNILAFDMGGTTAKLSVVDDGEPLIARRFEAAREKRFMTGSGLPLSISVIELIEIGAGGGSIARVDAMGLLKVGPESAGSQPGPAAYRRGGTHPTVTDADFILGYLDPAYFAGGTVAIDLELAREALRAPAAAAKLSLTQLAAGIYDVVNENMASAARVHISERGQDPRKYALIATGGAGPVHAFYVARKLGLTTLICPPAAGVASALGLLIAPARVDKATTRIGRLDAMDWAALEQAFRQLEAQALALVGQTGLAPDQATLERLADLRYVGQGFDSVVPLPAGPYAASSLPAIMRAFEDAYVKSFTRKPPSGAVEVVNIRVAARARTTDHDVILQGFAVGDGVPRSARPVYFSDYGDYRETPVYDRYTLPAGMCLDGPAVIEERESTLVIGPGGRVRVESNGNLVVTVPRHAGERDVR